MKLTKAQMSQIKKELISIKEELDMIQIGLQEHTTTFGTSHLEANDPTDYLSIARSNWLTNRKRELEAILESAQIIMTSKSEVIELGTKFKIRFEDGEEETLTMVEEASHSKNIDDYVSIVSPLGKSVLGKKEGDTFSYTVAEENFGGTILSLIKNKPKQKVKK